MSDWYSEAREADGRTDDEILAELRLERDAGAADLVSPARTHPAVAADRTALYEAFVEIARHDFPASHELIVGVLVAAMAATPAPEVDVFPDGHIRAGLLHGYTCGHCSWGRDRGRTRTEYDAHVAETGHVGDAPATLR